MFRFTRINNSKGFTLIELVIVMVVIAILAHLVFSGYNADSKQSEVKKILQQIYTLQNATFHYNGSYINDGEIRDSGSVFNFPGLPANFHSSVDVSTSCGYSFEMKATDSTFSCTATANIDDDIHIDRQTINEKRETTSFDDGYY